MPPDLIIHADGLVKSYDATPVLDGVDLAVEAGSIFAILGPNGAGKTTAIKILSTLTAPDAGHASIMGFDVVSQASDVRRVISLTGQSTAVDGFLTGEENLRMMARLVHLDARTANERVRELLDQFDLTESAGRKVATYSGGMRRRLDLAVSLIGRPPVIFLDEPTTGLDPRSRHALWGVVRMLAADGVTILLTTQYLEEADQLADRIALIDGGRVIASGTADDLKRGVADERVEVRFRTVSDLEAAVPVLAVAAVSAPVEREVDRLAASVATTDTATCLRTMLDDLGRHGLPIASIEIVRPTLDDVFFALTGPPTPASRITEEVAA